MVAVVARNPALVTAVNSARVAIAAAVVTRRVPVLAAAEPGAATSSW